MSTTNPIEVRDMRIIHETFRRAYEEAAQLVRANPTPSPVRVTFLADHVDFGLTMLHHHHEGEDEILYPLLGRTGPGTRGANRTDRPRTPSGQGHASTPRKWPAHGGAPRRGPSTAEALAASLDARQRRAAAPSRQRGT